MSNELIKRVAEAIRKAIDEAPFIVGVTLADMPGLYSVINKETREIILHDCTANAAEDLIEKLNDEYVARKAVEVLEKPEWWIKKEK